jgi:hypothetical protein
MFFNGLNGVIGAGGRVAATGWRYRRYQVLVHPDNAEKYFLKDPGHVSLFNFTLLTFSSSIRRIKPIKGQFSLE